MILNGIISGTVAPLGKSSGTVQLEIGAWVEIAFLQPHTANPTPHPAPVAPLAGHYGLNRQTAA